jgi:hypothetical protein
VGSRPSPALAVTAGTLVVGPVALAFWSGGYFDGPRLVALGGVAVVLLVLAVVAPAGSLLPRGAGPWAAVAGLSLLAGWVALSRGRSVLPDVAGDDAERVLLYAGFLVAGSIAWRRRDLARLAEPLVAGGILVVLLYALAGRWLPGIVSLTATANAGGRLEQPLTYWNAMGLVAAIGVVLCVRMAGDAERSADLRAGAAAAVVPLGCGVYLSFSRGALAALAAGLVVLFVCAPTRAQVRAGLVALVASGVAVAVCATLPGVRALEGGAGTRERQGLVALAVTLLGAAAAATLADRIGRSERRDGMRAFALPVAARWVAALLVVMTVAVPVLAARSSGVGRVAAAGQPQFGASTRRLTSLESNRYAYWRVALLAFRAHPVSGVGSGSFKAEWLRQRTIDDPAKDAHSLELETLAELGLVGFAMLLAVLGGVAASARRVWRCDPGLAAGPAAGLTVFLIHSGLDWDWEIPGATLPALTLAALLVARASAPAEVDA